MDFSDKFSSDFEIKILNIDFKINFFNTITKITAFNNFINLYRIEQKRIYYHRKVNNKENWFSFATTTVVAYMALSLALLFFHRSHALTGVLLY
jgi:hypothetical protein